jgi:hypothetical protein
MLSRAFSGYLSRGSGYLPLTIVSIVNTFGHTSNKTFMTVLPVEYLP